MKPILFNTEMVQAILNDSKTQTRRKIKYQGPSPSDTLEDFMRGIDPQSLVDCCEYQQGDVLWVRETWAKLECKDCKAKQCVCSPSIESNFKYGFAYKADTHLQECVKWYPSIHMPKEAARIFLRVTSVKVERLQDITAEQATLEGMTDKQKSVLAQEEYWYWFKELWNSTAKKADLDRYGWNANPWVWVISFERITSEEAKRDATD